MNYLVVTNNEYTIKKVLTKLFKELKLTEDMITNYNLEEQSIEDVLEDLDTYSFLTTKKLVICRNSNFLNNEKLEESKEKHLLKYLDNPNPDNYFIIITNKLDERKKIVKEIKKKVNILETKIDPKEVIREYFKEYKFDYNTTNLLLEYCHNDIEKLTSECQKLTLYKYEEKEITVEDVKKIVVKKINDDDDYIFELMTNIITKKKKEALAILNDLKTLGVEPLAILGMIANQYRFLLQVAILKERDYRQDEIASTLKAHPYRVKITLQNIREYSKEDLISSIKSLANIDLNIKKGNDQVDFAIENFIVSL